MVDFLVKDQLLFKDKNIIFLCYKTMRTSTVMSLPLQVVFHGQKMM